MPVDTDHPPTKHTCRVCGHYEYRHGVHRGSPSALARRVYSPVEGTHRRAPIGSFDALEYGYAVADEGVCHTFRPR